MTFLFIFLSRAPDLVEISFVGPVKLKIRLNILLLALLAADRAFFLPNLFVSVGEGLESKFQGNGCYSYDGYKQFKVYLALKKKILFFLKVERLRLGTILLYSCVFFQAHQLH